MKTCSKCRTPKPRGDFHKMTASKDGLKRWCIPCCRLYAAADKVDRSKTPQRIEYMKEYNQRSDVKSKNAARSRARPCEYHILKHAQERAKQLGVPFNLEYGDIFIPDICPLLGISLQRAKGRHNDNSPSLDRKVPDLGYVKGNVWVISWRANRIKCDATVDEIRLLAQRLTEHGV